MHIFIDSSVNHQKNKSIGCYLILDTLDTDFMDNICVDGKEFIDQLKGKIVSVNLLSNVSTGAELELALHVLGKINTCTPVNVYTDYNNLYNLKNRKYSQTHRLAETYNAINKFDNVNFIKVKGHNKKEKQINNYDKIFSYVDKRARYLVRHRI